MTGIYHAGVVDALACPWGRSHAQGPQLPATSRRGPRCDHRLSWALHDRSKVAHRVAAKPARGVPGGPPDAGIPGYLRRRDPRVDRAEPAQAAARARRRHDDILAPGGPPPRPPTS